MLPLPKLLVRAAYLIGVAAAPPFVSPAPSTTHVHPAAAIAAALLLTAVILGAGSIVRRIPGRAGLAAAVSIGAAVAAALIAASVFRGDRGPLGRGVLYVAVPLWAGLAVLTGTVAERHLRVGRARLLGIGLAFTVCAALFGTALGSLSSPERMWLAELRHDGDDAAAVDALVGAPLRARKYDAALAVLDRCLAAAPGACACMAGRVEAGLHALAPQQMVAEAVADAQRCPESASMRVAHAEALASQGDAAQGEMAARAGLRQADDPRLHYALCLALDREGRLHPAIEEAKRAVQLGVGRDASLALGAIAIKAGDFATAEEVLRPLVAADPGDADARFDLALVADRRNDYDRAREGYLSTLKVDPRYAAARNNLVYLMVREGALDEARQHAERFAADFPQDPRGRVLTGLVAASRTAPRPSPGAPPR